MKIELKSIKFYESLSEETNCFTANLYINGKKVGYVKNNGQGACTDYGGNSKEYNQIIKEAETYCKSLPKIKYDKHEFDNSLEHVIDDILYKYITAKERKKFMKKIAKSYAKAIVFGNPDGDKFRQIQWGKGIVLSNVPKDKLQEQVNRIKKEHCIDGVVIMNDNLEALGVTI